jgi:hypothetical protein
MDTAKLKQLDVELFSAPLNNLSCAVSLHEKKIAPYDAIPTHVINSIKDVLDKMHQVRNELYKP